MKKNTKIVAALALVGLLGLGTTYAVFSDKTVEKQNVFTIGSGINGEIYEPNWTGGSTGVEYSPNSDIDKDPQIKNESDDESAYIGLKLSYVLPTSAYTVYNENNGTTFKNNAEVLKALNYANEEAYIKAITAETVYNTTVAANKAKKAVNGTEVEGYWVNLTGEANKYMYVGNDGKALAVAPTNLTEPIFNQVSIIDTDITKMMPFEIKVQGFLVQTTNGTDAAVELAKLMK